MDYCTLKENCRRRFLLKALGSSETVTGHPCCDVCDPTNFPSVLHFEVVPNICAQEKKRKARRVAVRSVDQELMTTLRANLVAEREAYLSEHPSMRMLGPSFVCADSVIDKICDDAKFTAAIEDLDAITIGPDIKYRVIRSTFSFAPTSHRHTLHPLC